MSSSCVEDCASCSSGHRSQSTETWLVRWWRTRHVVPNRASSSGLATTDQQFAARHVLARRNAVAQVGVEAVRMNVIVEIDVLVGERAETTRVSDFGTKYSRSEYRNSVCLQRAISRDDRVAILGRLSHQQAIERVAMVPGQGTNAQRGG